MKNFFTGGFCRNRQRHAKVSISTTAKFPKYTEVVGRMNPENEQPKMHPGLEKIMNTLLDCFNEHIQLTGCESVSGILVRLRTEKCLEGIPSDDFTRPEMCISYDAGSPLKYRQRSLSALDFYDTCNGLLQEILKREKETHRRQLVGLAELSIRRTLRGSVTPAHFEEVYARCRKYFPSLPMLGSDRTKLEHAQGQLIKLKEKMECGGCISIAGLDFFNSIYWTNGNVPTCVFDRCKTYQTGAPESIQFREDLERYAKQARLI